MNHQSTLERIQKEIKETVQRENELKNVYTTKILIQHEDKNMNNTTLSNGHDRKDQKADYQQNKIFEKNVTLSNGYRKFKPNSNSGPNKGVMHKFLKAKGRLSLSSIKLNEVETDAAFKPAKFIIEKGSKPLRNGFVSAEEKMKKELYDFQTREAELRLERSKSQPDLMAALQLEDDLLDRDSQSIQSFSLHSAKSVSNLYSASTASDDGFDENHSSSSSLKPARSLAELCVLSDEETSTTFPETPFDLRKPYDLLALLEQETRRTDVNELYESLLSRKRLIEKKWGEIEKNSNIGIEITSEDINCRESSTFFTEIDLHQSIASNGTERGIIFDTAKGTFINKGFEEPICDNFNKLKRFSTLVNRSNIVLPPDEFLLKHYMPHETLEEFGNFISLGLRENPTSWVYYNLASFYWRIKGDGNKAIDCLKLSVQFVEEGFRDIPLYNLAGLLHHSKHSKEAVQILLSAIDLSPEEPLLYLAVGNILASLREYNRAVKFYDKLLFLKPDSKEGLNNRHAILCYSKLELALTRFQADLQSILSDLNEYNSIQERWLHTQERLIWELQPFKYHLDDFASADPSEKPKKIQRCVQKIVEGSIKPIISCDSYENRPDLGGLNLHHLYEFIENENQKLAGRLEYSFGDVIKKSMHKLIEHTRLQNGLKGSHSLDSIAWPTQEECHQLNLSLNDKEDLFLPVFLPPENKGYLINKILSDFIDLPEGSQQDLPWYPPVCEGENVDGDKYVSPHPISDLELKSTKNLRKELLKYVNKGNVDEAEIGQRIISAMNKKVAPRWILATLASLYWRVRGNAKKALDCLDMAFQAVPKDQTDVVLVSLASTLHQLGMKSQAKKFATLAFKINFMEPSTNFLLALLHYESNERAQAIYYLKNTVKYDKNYYDGMADTLLKSWSCRLKLGINQEIHQSEQSSKIPSHTCSQITTENEVIPKLKPKLGLHCYVETDNGIELANLEIFEANNKKRNLGQSLISTLLAAEGSGDLEPDQSRLEVLNDQGKIIIPPTELDHLHIKLSLGERHPFKQFRGLNDFFVSVSLSDEIDAENQLHVYDQFSSYLLCPSVCRKTDIHEMLKYSIIWPSVSVRSLDISDLLHPMPDTVDEYSELKPYCMNDFNLPMPENVESLIQKYLKQGVVIKPNQELTELLRLMAGQKLSVAEFGVRLGASLKHNEASWILLTASAIYWMTIGNTEYSLSCLRAAITQVPNDALDIPLYHLTNFLNRAGFYKDALQVANIALRTYPNYALNHYTTADIYINSGQFEKAVAYLRAAISLDPKFAPARTKLQALLCKILFDDSLSAYSVDD